MNSDAIIGLSVLLCFIASSTVAGNYITPRLQAWSREDAIKALVAPHMFRFVGLAFLMPGVVSPTLSPAFANPAAYGDLTAAILAMIAVVGPPFARRGRCWQFDLQYQGTTDPLCLSPRHCRRPQPLALLARHLHSDADRAAVLVTHALIFR
jgi:hypothetical protein